MPISFRVEGSASLKRKLAGLQTGVQGRLLERALTAGALIVQNAAKTNAPFKTGNLRRSIHIGGHEDLAGDYSGIQQESGDPVPQPEGSGVQVAVYIGTNVIYARQREYGGTITARNGPFLWWKDDDGKWHHARSVHQAATPYMRPAIDENGDEVRREVGEALADLIRAAVR